MGLFWAKMKVMFDELGTVQARILMLGLDAAGETSYFLLFKLAGVNYCKNYNFTLVFVRTKRQIKFVKYKHNFIQK